MGGAAPWGRRGVGAPGGGRTRPGWCQCLHQAQGFAPPAPPPWAPSGGGARTGALGRALLRRGASGSWQRGPGAVERGASLLPRAAGGAGKGSGAEGANVKSDMLRVSWVVGLATLASKVLGMLREAMMAAAFGVGPVAVAYSYASLLPGFFQSLLGGINGPIHTAVSTTVGREQSREKASEIVESLATLLGAALLVCSAAILVAAPLFIDLAAPGLVRLGSEGEATRALAVLQLRAMAPSALLSGLTGIGFGALNVAGRYVVPSLSPALSSLSIMAALSVWFAVRGHISGDAAVWGSVFLSAGYLLGLFMQWFTQAWVQHRSGVGRFLRVRFFTPRNDPRMQQIFRLLVPATVSSGMLQLATYTDMFFASFIPGAAACMGYANLLVMAPLGILSSAILVPAVPVFARFSEESEWPLLVDKAQGVLVLSLAATLCLSAWLAPLAEPIVRVLFQRKAFGAAATASVAPLVICYTFGASAYLLRDVLVRLFYAIDEAGWTFYLSMLALAANVLLDWVLCLKLGFGAPGLILATTAVNALSVLILFQVLGGKVRRAGAAFQWTLLAEAGAKLLLCTGVGVLVAWGTFFALDTAMALLLRKVAGGAFWRWASQILAIGAASLLSTTAFASLCAALSIPEAEDVARRIGRGLRKDFNTVSARLSGRG